MGSFLGTREQAGLTTRAPIVCVWLCVLCVRVCVCVWLCGCVAVAVCVWLAGLLACWL